MLEERLSKAYSQHSIGGYNLPAPRQPSGPYPTIQASAPSAAGPAESFYTGEQQQDYGRPIGHPAYHQSPQPTGHSQYAPYDKRGSVVGLPNGQYPSQQMPQRTGSWGNAQGGQAPQYNQQPSYPPHEAAPSQASHLQQTQAQTPLVPPASIDSVSATPTNDPNASYYFTPQSQSQQQPGGSASDASQSAYPNLSQGLQSYQPSLPQTPASAAAQPSQPPPQHQATPQQPQQPYWQHPAAQQTALPAVYQAPPSASYSNYGHGQEAFPSAPQHVPTPKQPVVEESLIDL